MKWVLKGLPGGGRDLDGTFGNIGRIGKWWTSAASNLASVWYRGMEYADLGFGTPTTIKEQGFLFVVLKISVRREHEAAISALYHKGLLVSAIRSKYQTILYTIQYIKN